MLTRWSDVDRTFAMMDELRRRMDQAFGGFDSNRADKFGLSSGTSTWPRLSIFDTDAALVVKAEVPGMAEKDINLTIVQDVLTLSGERKSDVPEGYAVHRQERAPLRFARSLTLPCKVNTEQTSASLKNGVLTVTLPKAAESKPKQITVKTS